MGKGVFDYSRASDEENGRSTREKKNEWLFVNPYLIVGIVGASFCFSWFFSTLLTPDFVCAGVGNEWMLQPLHIVFAAALLVAYLVIWRASNAFQSHRGVLLGVSLVCGVVGTVPWGGAPSLS